MTVVIPSVASDLAGVGGAPPVSEPAERGEESAGGEKRVVCTRSFAVCAAQDDTARNGRFLVFLAAAAIYIPLLLLSDRRGFVPQLALGLATAAFLSLFARRSQVPPREIIVAIVVATIGECVLSLGWGLYTYQHALIPLYVPPGHGLFFALAAETARQPLLQRHERFITRAVLVAGSVIALASLVAFRDEWGLLWWIGAMLLIRRSRNSLMLSACFVYTILLEWTGTAIGNWRWEAIVPLVGLHSANPPSGVGILYVLLDLITVAGVAQASSLRPLSRQSAG